jgi:hypothetical protein
MSPLLALGVTLVRQLAERLIGRPVVLGRLFPFRTYKMVNFQRPTAIGGP